jgi:hypothetical protein
MIPREYKLRYQVPVSEGTGTAYPASRFNGASRDEEVPLGVGSSFDANDFFASYDRPMDSGPPYAVKGASHAEDRIEERTPLPRSTIRPLQAAVDKMGLPPGTYHLPLRGKNGEVVGYAQFKAVPNRDRPVLATVLHKYMSPGGQNIERMMKTGAQPETNVSARSEGLFSTDQLDPRRPESRAWNLAHQLAGRDETQEYETRRMFDQMKHTFPEAIESPMEAPTP